MKLKLTPCLWFHGQAEQAAAFYTSVFPNSRITQISRYGEAGKENHRQEPGSVMVVAFELDGNPFTALNGPPLFKFNEAVSFQVECKSQEEIDYYWEKLTEGGDPSAQQCGWLKTNSAFPGRWFRKCSPGFLQDPLSPNSQRAFAAVMQMKKFNISELQRAYDGY